MRSCINDMKSVQVHRYEIKVFEHLHSINVSLTPTGFGTHKYVCLHPHNDQQSRNPYPNANTKLISLHHLLLPDVV